MVELVFLPVLIFAIVIHECAHGLVAKWCGDDTADREGRITLNPIKHIDLWGSIIIPVLLAITSAGLMFGWAKPVPVNPNNFRSIRRDDIYVSMAGPLSNIILAVITAFLIFLTAVLFPSSFPLTENSSDGAFFAWNLLNYSIKINLILALFNLIPIPPLDGSHVIANLLPNDLAEQYRSLGFMGMFILVAMMATGVIGRVIGPVFHFMRGLLEDLINILLH